MCCDSRVSSTRKEGTGKREAGRERERERERQEGERSDSEVFWETGSVGFNVLSRRGGGVWPDVMRKGGFI